LPIGALLPLALTASLVHIPLPVGINIIDSRIGPVHGSLCVGVASVQRAAVTIIPLSVPGISRAWVAVINVCPSVAISSPVIVGQSKS
jgi:hypothetical protein